MLATLVFAYLALVIASHIVVVGAVAWARRRAGMSLPLSRRLSRDLPLRRWLVAAAVGVALLSPFLLALSHQKSQISWIVGIGWSTWQQVFVTQWFWGTAALPVLAWLLMGLGAVALLRRTTGSAAALHIGDTTGPSIGILAISGVVIPTAALLLESAVASPLYSPRYLTMSAPFVAILIAAGLLRLGELLPRIRMSEASRLPAVATIGILAIATLSIPHLATVSRAPAAKENSTWGQVASLISAQRAALPATDDTAIIYGPVRYHPSATTRVIEVAYPAAFAGTTDVTLATPADQRGELWESTHPLGASTGRLTQADVTFLITSIKQNRVPSATSTLTALGWHLTEHWTLGDVQVVRYDR